MLNVALVAALAGQAIAFPFVAESVGMSKEDFVGERLGRRDAEPELEARQYPVGQCPFNADHQPAVPFNIKYPYCGAQNGGPGFQFCINNQVPAPGDRDHRYIAPTKNDIRGPCPGLNTAANHGFLARDGIVTFAELTDAQQNVYGVGYDLAILLAVFGVGLDGDPITRKLSIGCDATSRTASPGLGPEPGLNGHNKFEGDTSLTRNDYFTAGGDNYSFNETLYNMMLQDCAVGGAGCNRENLGRYRVKRYNQSLNENGNFYFGPKSVLLYGAASFLYELFPSLGDLGKPDKTTMDFFFKKEQLPPNWFSRVTPYTIPEVAIEIFRLYELGPVAFGGNTGKPNTFNGIGQNGPVLSQIGSPEGVACLLYQVATDNTPSSIGGGGAIPQANLNWMRSTLNPVFQNPNNTVSNFGCPLKVPGPP